MELVDLSEYGPDDDASITGGEPDAYGTHHLGIEWGEKTAHVGLFDDHRLIGHAGWVHCRVRTTDGEEWDGLGLGGVMVHADYRGRGLGARLVEATMERMRSDDATIALLFCRSERLAFYGRLGWLPVLDPVTVDQPGGPVLMPLHTCWTPLRGGAALPAGALRLLQLPF